MSVAQDLLDEIHSAGIQGLYRTGLANDERLADLKLVRQKLNLVKRKLRDEQKTAKGNWDARKGSYEKRMQDRALAPFELIDDILARVELNLKELENDVRFDRPIPQPPVFGTVVLETEDRIAILTHDEALEYCRKKNHEAMEHAQNVAREVKQELEDIQRASGIRKLLQGAKLERRSEELKSGLLAAKQLYVASKALDKLQAILDVPACQEIMPQSFSVGISDKEDALQELARLDKIKPQLAQLVEEVQSLPDMVDFFKSFLTGVEKMQNDIKEHISKLE